MSRTDFIEAMEAEIAAIEAELKADPKWVRLQSLKALRVLYGVPGATFTKVEKPERRNILQEIASSAEKRVKAHKRGRAMSIERARALQMAKNFLDPVKPMKTAELWPLLEAAGVTLGGENPQNNLASLLIRAEGIRSHGRAGWTLEPEMPEAEDDLLSGQASSASIPSGSTPGPNPTWSREPGAGGGT